MTPGQRFLLISAPQVGFFLMAAAVAIVLARRKAEAERRDETPFASAPYVVEDPLPFLRKQTSMERLYIKEGLKPAFAIYGFLSCTGACLLSSMALSAVSPYAALWPDPAARVWYSLLSMPGIEIVLTLFPVMFAVGSMLPLRAGAIGARFYLTRPISMSVLFWTRVLPSIAALIAGLVTAVCVVLGLIWMFHGPVWQHLPSTVPLTAAANGPDCECVGMYTNMLVTSAPRLLLSMLTTAALCYSASIAVLIAPLNRNFGSGAPVTIIVLFGGMFVLFVLRLFQILSKASFALPRQLFVYTEFGPPPPYSYALVPVALTIGLLLLSRSFVNRLEV